MHKIIVCDIMESMAKVAKTYTDDQGNVVSCGQAGTQAKALNDLSRYLAHPDSLMVSHGVASNQLSSTDNMNITPNKLFEDGGHNLDVVRFIAQRGREMTMPKTVSELMDSVELYFEFCSEYKVPVTIGLLACWNGVSLARLNQIERNVEDERSPVITYCKELVRGFLEISAMSGQINPILYFHQNKVYFGAIEVNAQVNVGIDDNSLELTKEEAATRIQELIYDDTDNVYKPPRANA